MHAGAGCAVPQRSVAAACLLKVVHLLANGEGLLTESAIEQLLPPCCVAGARGYRLRLGDEGKGRVGSIHQLQVLLVLCRGAFGHLVHPLRFVAFSQPAEESEGRKK